MKIKILFFADYLYGGRRRFLLNVLKYINKDRFEPVLVLFKKEGIYEDEIQNDIPGYIINIDRAKRFPFPIFPFISYRLRKILSQEKPQIIFCFGWYGSAISYFATRSSVIHPKIIINEDTFLSEHLRFHIRGFFYVLIKRFVKFSYKRSELIITVSRGVKDDLINEFNVPEEKIKVIHNPVDLERIMESSEEKVTHTWFNRDIPIIISAGRLVPSKGFDMLLKAFSLVRKNFEAKLIILGEGSGRRELKGLRDQLGLKGDVDFLGFQSNPWKYMAKSAIFVMSSFYEGLPNVIIEAMSLGVPVISTDCPSGPEEILEGGKNGILVPRNNENALAESILKLLKDDSLRDELSKKGKRRAKDYDVNIQVKALEEAMIEKTSQTTQFT